MLTLILTILAVENLAEIFITKIDLKECLAWFGGMFPRLAALLGEALAWFWKTFPVLKKLTGCKYCQMFWLAGLFLLLPMPLLVTTWLAIHRLAQLASEFFERYFSRAPISVFVQKPSDFNQEKASAS